MSYTIYTHIHRSSSTKYKPFSYIAVHMFTHEVPLPTSIHIHVCIYMYRTI